MSDPQIYVKGFGSSCR